MTLANGDVSHYFMDTDYFVPIKIETQAHDSRRRARVRDHLSATTRRWPALPAASIESKQKGNPNKSQVTYEKIEANVALDDARFRKPGATAQSPTAPDASETQPKKPEDQKPPRKAPPSRPRTNRD